MNILTSSVLIKRTDLGDITAAIGNVHAVSGANLGDDIGCSITIAQTVISCGGIAAKAALVLSYADFAFALCKAVVACMY